MAQYLLGWASILPTTWKRPEERRMNTSHAACLFVLSGTLKKWSNMMDVQRKSCQWSAILTEKRLTYKEFLVSKVDHFEINESFCLWQKLSPRCIAPPRGCTWEKCYAKRKYFFLLSSNPWTRIIILIHFSLCKDEPNIHTFLSYCLWVTHLS